MARGDPANLTLDPRLYVDAPPVSVFNPLQKSEFSGCTGMCREFLKRGEDRVKTIIVSGALAALLASGAPVLAGPSFGLGLSFVFGSGVALGGRVFSTDKPQNGALSLGVDYKFANGAVRPNIGVGYLDQDVYTDFSVGIDMQSRDMDFGIGVGGLGGMK
jgi:hypothetical protein